MVLEPVEACDHQFNVNPASPEVFFLPGQSELLSAEGRTQKVGCAGQVPAKAGAGKESCGFQRRGPPAGPGGKGCLKGDVAEMSWVAAPSADILHRDWSGWQGHTEHTTLGVTTGCGTRRAVMVQCVYPKVLKAYASLGGEEYQDSTK